MERQINNRLVEQDGQKRNSQTAAAPTAEAAALRRINNKNGAGRKKKKKKKNRISIALSLHHQVEWTPTSQQQHNHSLSAPFFLHLFFSFGCCWCGLHLLRPSVRPSAMWVKGARILYAFQLAAARSRRVKSSLSEAINNSARASVFLLGAAASWPAQRRAASTHHAFHDSWCVFHTQIIL